MLLGRANLVAHAAEADASRPEYRVLCLLEDGTLSTNGRRLVFVPYPRGLSVEDFPRTVEGSTVPLPAAVEMSALERAVGSMPKRARTAAEQCVVLSMLDGAAVILTASPNEPPVRCSLKPPFVSTVQALLPSGDATATARCSLDELRACLEDLSRAGAAEVVIGVHEKGDPVVLLGLAGTIPHGEEILAAIMPLMPKPSSAYVEGVDSTESADITDSAESAGSEDGIEELLLLDL